MPWGNPFKAAWDGATNAARETVGALATGAKCVADATAATVQFLAKEAKVIAKTTVEVAKTVGRAVVKIAGVVKDKIVSAAEWTAQMALRLGKAIVKGAIIAAKVAVKAIVAAFDLAKKVFAAVVAAVSTVACVAYSWAVGGIALAVGAVLTKPLLAQLFRPLLRLGKDGPPDLLDGHTIGKDCSEVSSANPSGVMPSGCKQTAGSLPKISYINGINTNQKTICETMKKLANDTCSEVMGIYNATHGITKDIDECLDNIGKSSNEPAVAPMKKMIVEAAENQKPLTLYAHSQGGLITQEAISQAKQELMMKYPITAEEAEKALGVVSVKSFGTAMMGWPKGPEYERFTNTSDPIPPAILGAQTSYPLETWKDSAEATQHHVFTSPHLNPIESHSMDDVYLEELKAVKGAPYCACKAA